jgi:hypothetical protein
MTSTAPTPVHIPGWTTPTTPLREGLEIADIAREPVQAEDRRASLAPLGGIDPVLQPWTVGGLEPLLLERAGHRPSVRLKFSKASEAGLSHPL